ncbi:hypothetical protein NL676_019007 [Syzygium grande]|nr:hypothetical protein NL676_019007 [Syzygium grande]
MIEFAITTLWIHSCLWEWLAESDACGALLLVLALSNAVTTRRGDSDGKCEYKLALGLDPRQHTMSITEFGAVGDGKTLNTVTFLNAIFYLKSFADKGGAQLYVPPARWLTGSFNLTNHLTLFLEKGAMVLASQDPSPWEIGEHLPSYGRGIGTPGRRYRSLINGYGLHDVVITDSSDNVCIEDCSISMGYDSITLKSGWDEYGISYDRPTSHVHIRRAYLQSYSRAAIAFVGEMSGGISNVYVNRVSIYSSSSGIAFRTTQGRGGYIEDITVSDVDMDDVHLAFGAKGHFGSHPDENFNPNALPVLCYITLQNVGAVRSMILPMIGSIFFPVLLVKDILLFGELMVAKRTQQAVHCPWSILQSILTANALVMEKKISKALTALDRANAGDALLPLPTFTDLGERKKPHQYSGIDPDEVIADIVNSRSRAKSLESEQMHDDDLEVGTSTVCLEDQLRSLGFISGNDGSLYRSAPDPAFLKDINLEANLSNKKIRDTILSMGASDAYNLLRKLLALWQSRSSNAKLVLPWISRILVIHSDYVLSQEPMNELLYSLGKTAKARGAAIQPLLQLVGWLQLVVTTIDKATHNQTRDSLQERQADESDDEDEDIDHVFYRDEDESGQTSDDTDDE